MSTPSQPSLAELTDRLSALADAQAEPDVAEVRRQLRENRFRVLIAGEAKRGKSTVVNAVLGRELVPTGAVPVTAVATTVAQGIPERVVVRAHDGAVAEYPATALADFVTESGNPRNRREVAAVTLLIEHPLLADGVELVDTPGIGSVHEHNDDEAYAAYRSMDAAVFVLTADPPISASELDLFRRLAAASVHVFVLLNKIDRLDPDELEQATGYVHDVLSGANATARIYPCSARRALAARTSGSGHGDDGLERFEADLRQYLGHGRDAELTRSLTRRLRVIAAEVLDGLRVVLAVDAMRTEEQAARVAEFTDRLHRVEQRGMQAADLVTAGTRRLLERLNAAAAAAEPTLSAQVVAALDDQLRDALAEAGAKRLQHAGRKRAVRLVRDTVEEWRREQEQALEQGVEDLQRVLIDGLAAELTGIQSAARDLLDLELTAQPDRRRLVTDRRFTYLLIDQAGQTELLAGAVRRRLPGRWGRQRVRAHLLSEADLLTRQQIGRVRADLQARLRASTPGLIRSLTGRYRASFSRLAKALDDARALRAHPEGAERDCATGRANALDQLLDDLGRLGTDGPDRSSATC